MPKPKRSKSSATKRANTKAAPARSPAAKTTRLAKKPAPKAGAKAKPPAKAAKAAKAIKPAKAAARPAAKRVGARPAMTRVAVKQPPKGAVTRPARSVDAKARAEAAARITAAKGKANAGKRSAAAAKAAPQSAPRKAAAKAAPVAKNAGPWPGRFVWHDLMTTDAAASQAFYAALFGWQIEERPMSGFTYRMIHAGPGPIGGIVEEKNIPVSHWMPYVAVADVDAAAKLCAELGGTTCVPPTDIPQTGRFAVVGDPQGAYFSLFKGLPTSPGFDPDLPVVGRVCWNELLTSDPQAAQAFYTALFGWQEEPMDMGPMGVYRVQKQGAAQAGGMMAHPQPGAPSCWLAYFATEDLAGSTRKAAELGAKVMVANAPIPGIGAFSLLTDPVGAVFALFWAQPGSRK